MPCYDPRDSASYVEEHELKPLRNRLARVEAMLCGVLTAAEGWGVLDNLLSDVDYKEAGLTRADIIQWFEQHKIEDKRRKERETADQAAYRKRKMRQLSALANELGVTLLPKGSK